MATHEEFERALGEALPAELRRHARPLAALLAELAAGRPSPPAPGPELAPAVRALAGRELRAGASLVSFGDGSQLGDVTIGDVAGGDITRVQLTIDLAPRSTAVGRNIIQIGTLVLPAWLILAIAGLLAAAAGAGYLALRGPATMGGTFNVAVAEFALDSGGRLADSPEAARYSAQAFQALVQQQQANLDLDSTDLITVWHDSLSWREKRSRIGFIPGATAAEREAAAQARLRELGADILIYGYLDPQGLVRLHFYVRPDLIAEEAAGTIGGDYQVGGPLRPADRELTTRAAAIFWLAKAIQFDREGRPDQSLRVLGQAEQRLFAWDQPGQGKELLYLFAGRAALYQAQLAADEPAFAAGLELAAGHLEAARRWNPDLLRAEVLRGNLHLLRAQCLLGAMGLPCAAPPAEPAALEQRYAGAAAEVGLAVAAYERAVALGADGADWLWAQGVAPASLGAAYYVRAEVAFLRGEDGAAAAGYAEAAAAMAPALAVFRDAGSPRLLGQTLLAAGTAALRGGDLAGEPGPRRERYQAAAGWLEECLGLGGGPPDRLLSERVIPACADRLEYVRSQEGRGAP